MQVAQQCFFYLLLSILVLFSSQNYAASLRDFGQHADDAVLTSKVKYQLVRAPGLDSMKVSVSTHNGVVRLSGVLDNQRQYQTALTWAQSVDGVHRVDARRLRILASKAPNPDLELLAKVNGILLKNKLIGDERVNRLPVTAKAHEGKVTLSGELRSARMKSYIVSKIKRLDQVTHVDASQLVVG